MKIALTYSALALSVITANTAFSDATMLEEVVVTAQHRAQALQDTAVAIDALSSDRLLRAGIKNVADLTDIVPALTVADGGGIAGQLYMRGVGNAANNNYLDPAIILTLDGVPIARGSAASVGAFYDIERVEVLKGPQGTLYGKNATGGVINILPVKPVLGELGGFLSGDFGNYSARQVSGAINVPVTESSAFRVAASKVERDGYNKDGTNDDDKESIRAQFLLEPNERLSLRLAGDYTDIGGVGPGTSAIGHYVRNGPPVPGLGLANFSLVEDGVGPLEGSNTDAGNDYRNSILAAPGFGFLNDVQDSWYVDAQLYGANAEVNYQTDLGVLTFILGYRNAEQDSMFNGPGFNSGWWQTETEQTTYELRFAGDFGERFSYLAGAFYFEEESYGNNTFNQEFVLPTQEYTQDSNSWAVFGEGTFHISDTVRLVVGARYTDDHKEIDGSIQNMITFCGGVGPDLITPPGSFGAGCATPGNLPHFPTLDSVQQAEQFLIGGGWVTQEAVDSPSPVLPLINGVAQILRTNVVNQQSYDEKEPTYRVVLEWDAGLDSLVYASFETGYRTGGLQPSSSATYDPEYIDAFTIGSKNRFLEGRLQINGELFYWDYQDQQISYFTLSDHGVLENLTDNVGVATSKGVDVDVQWLATDTTLLTAKLQWLNATYDDLHFQSTIPRDNINCPYTIFGVNDEGDPLLDFNCSGNDAIYSPEWTLMLGAQQTIPMGSMELIASIDTTWVDDQVAGFQNLPHQDIDSYWRTNVDLTLRSLDDTWSISAYVRNLEDDAQPRSSQTPLLGMAMVSYGADRTYGMRLNYRF